ncbi:MAG: DUF533 domain-containing protein [Planctomycetota bacterium]
MDAIKILGSLLSNNAMGSPAGGNILDSLLGGSNGSQGGDILGTLLGGQKRGGGGGGLGALGAILAAAAASRRGGGGGSGIDILGSLLGGSQGGGGVLGSLLGGGYSQQTPQRGGGLGGLLGSLLGGGQRSGAAPQSGAGALLGSLLGGQSGGSGNPLGGLLGVASQSQNGSDLLGALLGGGTPKAPPKEAQEEAEILIAAMCNAAKSDGTIDEGEKEAILGRLGELDEEEIAYLKKHLAGPVDIDQFVFGVPDDMDEQVYAFSLMAIRLDTQKEAQYFGQLANGLGLDGDTCNRIHAQLGQPEIFA